VCLSLALSVSPRLHTVFDYVLSVPVSALSLSGFTSLFNVSVSQCVCVWGTTSFSLNVLDFQYKYVSLPFSLSRFLSLHILYII
jgi:hypothetical protein